MCITNINAVNFIYPEKAPNNSSSFNSFGQVGLIQTPSALSSKEGNITFTLNNNQMWKFGTLTISPFSWLEASYFYYRPSDLEWLGNDPGLYLDKGFNVKFIYESRNNLPNIAIGLDDFAGTGYFSREYIVTTSSLNNLDMTLGIGWGKFAGENSFKNPIGIIKESFEVRPGKSATYNFFGGSPTYDQWFRGNSSFFGGIEYSVPKTNGLRLKLEFDPYDYMDFSANNRPDADLNIRKKDSKLNIGMSMPYNNFITFNVSYIKGNTLNFGFVMSLNLNNELLSKPKFEPSIEQASDSATTFYEQLLLNLNNNKLFLQTADLDTNNKLDISISTSEHRNAIRSSSYAASIAKEVANINLVNLNSINVSHINAGIEINNITYIANHLDKKSKTPVEVKKYYTKIDSGNSDSFKQHEFQPKLNFPIIFSTTQPTLTNYIGNPGKFYYGGLNIQNNSEIQFSRNAILSSEIGYRLYSKFDDITSNPDSLLEHVRTDVVDYLQEENLYLSRMQFDYIWSPYKNIYTKVSSGLFEQMFGGIGSEILYQPFDKNYSFGAELFYVKQRSPNGILEFRDYSTITGHLNFGYKLPLGIESNLSFGRYLAKDDGYTLDLSRTTKSGFKSGVFFTKTNISAEMFGEGSFNKGFYFQIPLDLITGQYSGNYSTFKISPLTRDGGAKLIHDKDLRGLIYNSTYRELNQQWRGFLN